jgi:hypothetical protein
MESEADIYVYRSGKLARFGHNHIITSRDIFGYIMLGKDQGSSRLDLYFPVDTLSIDEPELRAAAGDDFSSQPSANDIAGTRKNMLGGKLLEADKFPSIRVRGTGPLGAAGNQTFKLTVDLVGKSIDLTVPAEVTVDDAGVAAHGTFELTHSELGLQPFSVMLGAIQVADKMSFSYDIKTRKPSGNP